jgi:hypothetical protein
MLLSRQTTEYAGVIQTIQLANNLTTKKLDKLNQLKARYNLFTRQEKDYSGELFIFG